MSEVAGAKKSAPIRRESECTLKKRILEVEEARAAEVHVHVTTTLSIFPTIMIITLAYQEWGRRGIPPVGRG